MVYEFKLPDIGEGVHEGEIVKWHVKTGDAVKEDQLIVEVMTDKATVEITSPKTGRIADVRAKEGEVVPVGTIVLVIDDAGGAPSATAAPPKGNQPPPIAFNTREMTLFEGQPLHEVAKRRSAPAAPPAKPVLAPASPKAPPPIQFNKKEMTLFEGQPMHEVAVRRAPTTRAPAATSAGRVLAAPGVKRRAREAGIDLAELQGTGPNGRITVRDLQAVQVPAPTPAAPARAAPVPAFAGETIPFRGLRRKIAEGMRKAKDTAAHFTYVDELDATELVALKAAAQPLAEARGIKLTFLPFVMKATIAALKAFPITNSRLNEEAGVIELLPHYHLGFAVAAEVGLLVPVVKDADKKSVFQIATEIDELSAKTRAQKATVQELTGSTFTITSLGKLGGILATPILNVPEVGIMGVHAIRERPVVRDGKIVIGQTMNLSFTFDHRIVDGYVAAQFAQTVIKYLQDPKLLLLETV